MLWLPDAFRRYSFVTSSTSWNVGSSPTSSLRRRIRRTDRSSMQKPRRHWTGSRWVDWAWSPLSRLWRELKHASDVTPTVSALRYHLLFCDGVAVEAPLLRPVTWVHPGDPYAPFDLRQLSNALRVLAQIAPLIDEGLVFVVLLIRRYAEDDAQLQIDAGARVRSREADPLGDLDRDLLDLVDEDLREEREYLGSTSNSASDRCVWPAGHRHVLQGPEQQLDAMQLSDAYSDGVE
jgi:hypothetical protein